MKVRLHEDPPGSSPRAGDSATVWAPATVANLAVGFDCLGCALERPGETMVLRRTASRGVVLSNAPGTSLPLTVERNVAGRSAASLLRHLDADFGVEILVDKSILPGSGIGSSAASAAAAVVGVSALAATPCSLDVLLECAIDGEEVASGSRHADNVAPALWGGLTLVDPTGQVHRLPTPQRWVLVVLHPQVPVSTLASRACLPAVVPLGDAARQAAWMARFVHMLHGGQDEDALASMQDLLVETHREALLPAYRACQEAAHAAGAVAGGISGSGPSSFWVCLTSEAAVAVGAALRAVMDANNQPCRVYTTPISARGACVVSKSWQG